MADTLAGNTNANYGENFANATKSGGTVKLTTATADSMNRSSDAAAMKDYSKGGAINVFNGVTGFSGFYKAYDGLMTSIAFQRAGTKQVLDASFLVQTVNINWGRSINLQRVLNNTKPIAMVGVGNGTLSLGGMVGTYGAFARLVEDDNKENSCHPLSAVIASGTGFVGCTDSGDQKDLYGVGINLSNLLLTNITYTHEFAAAGDIVLQRANLTFMIGGMGLIPIGTK